MQFSLGNTIVQSDTGKDHKFVVTIIIVVCVWFCQLYM